MTCVERQRSVLASLGLHSHAPGGGGPGAPPSEELLRHLSHQGQLWPLLEQLGLLNQLRLTALLLQLPHGYAGAGLHGHRAQGPWAKAGVTGEWLGWGLAGAQGGLGCSGQGTRAWGGTCLDGAWWLWWWAGHEGMCGWVEHRRSTASGSRVRGR